MTVIAAFDDLGLIFSDVLLSYEGGGGHALLPSTGHTKMTGVELKVSPTRLVRKIHKFKLYKDIGYLFLAGTVKHLEKLVQNFEDIKNNQLDLPEDLRPQLNIHDSRSIANVASILTERKGFAEFEVIVVVAGERLTRALDVHQSLSHLPYFGHVNFIGGGARDLFAWLSEKGQAWEELLKQERGEYDIKRFRAMNYVPSMLLEEDTRETLRTVAEGVGGYYETFLVEEDGVRAVDSVLTVFGALKGKGSKAYIELRRLFFHLYIDEWLFVISVFNLPKKILADKALHIAFSDIELFKISPIFQPPAEPNWKVSRLAVEMRAPQHTSISLYREKDPDFISIKRFYSKKDPRCANLFRISVQKNGIDIVMKSEDLFHFSNKCSAGPDLTQPQ